MEEKSFILASLYDLGSIWDNKVDESEEEIKDQIETSEPTGTKATGTRLKKYHPQE